MLVDYFWAPSLEEWLDPHSGYAGPEGLGQFDRHDRDVAYLACLVVNAGVPVANLWAYRRTPYHDYHSHLLQITERILPQLKKTNPTLARQIQRFAERVKAGPTAITPEEAVEILPLPGLTVSPHARQLPPFVVRMGKGH